MSDERFECHCYERDECHCGMEYCECDDWYCDCEWCDRCDGRHQPGLHDDEPATPPALSALS